MKKVSESFKQLSSAARIAFCKNQKVLFLFALLFIVGTNDVFAASSGLDKVVSVFQDIYTQFKILINILFGIAFLYAGYKGLRKGMDGENAGWLQLGGTFLGAIIWYAGVPLFLSGQQTNI